MFKREKNRTLFRAFLVVISGVVLLFLLYFPSHRKLGDYFAVSIAWIMISYSALGIGIIYLLLRIFHIIKDNGGLLYVIAGIINAGSGILAIILYMLNGIERGWLHDCLLNLLIGTLIFSDIFLFTNEK